MSDIPFTKMHGLGNDFVVIDQMGSFSKTTQTEITPELARKICDRRFGIGADQILWLREPKDSALDLRMEILNADGSTAEMCGNGIRAVALYMSRYHHSAPTSALEYAIETLAGVQRVKVTGESVNVNMGQPKLGSGFSEWGSGSGERLKIKDRELAFYEVSMGNPHAVFFVDQVDGFPLEEIGPLIEKHPRFPNRTNVEFVEVRNRSAIKVRVWERGAGITLACGTGACASAAAVIALNKTGSQVEVQLPGGTLKLKWEGLGQPLFMEGPATEVFQGVYRIC